MPGFDPRELRDPTGKWTRGGVGLLERMSDEAQGIGREMSHADLTDKIRNLDKGKKFGHKGATIDNIPSKGIRVRVGGKSQHYDHPADAARSVLAGEHVPPTEGGSREAGLRRIVGGAPKPSRSATPEPPVARPGAAFRITRVGESEHSVTDSGTGQHLGKVLKRGSKYVAYAANDLKAGEESRHRPVGSFAHVHEAAAEVHIATSGEMDRIDAIHKPGDIVYAEGPGLGKFVRYDRGSAIVNVGGHEYSVSAGKVSKTTQAETPGATTVRTSSKAPFLISRINYDSQGNKLGVEPRGYAWSESKAQERVRSLNRRLPSGVTTHHVYTPIRNGKAEVVPNLPERKPLSETERGLVEKQKDMNRQIKFDELHKEWQNALNRVLTSRVVGGNPYARRDMERLEGEMRKLGARPSRTEHHKWEIPPPPPKPGSPEAISEELHNKDIELIEMANESGAPLYTARELLQTRSDDVRQQIQAGYDPIVAKVPSGSEVMFSNAAARFALGMPLLGRREPRPGEETPSRGADIQTVGKALDVSHRMHDPNYVTSDSEHQQLKEGLAAVQRLEGMQSANSQILQAAVVKSGTRRQRAAPKPLRRVSMSEVRKARQSMRQANLNNQFSNMTQAQIDNMLQRGLVTEAEVREWIRSGGRPKDRRR
jgi:hypothetical protein